MVQQNDVLSKLQTLRFRGIAVPVTRCTMAFSQEQSENKFLFRNNAIIESLGRKNLIFTYIIPFREGVSVGDYKDLFTKTFYDFLNACRDSTAGKLEDPALGMFDAKCISWSGDLDALKRDGADVTVEFIHAPTENEVDADGIINVIPTVNDGKDAARQLDDTVSKVKWVQKEPPKPTVNPLDAISGIMRQGISYADRVGAAISDTIARTNNILDALEVGSKKTSEILKRTSGEAAQLNKDTTTRITTADQWLIKRQCMDLKDTLASVENVIFPNETVKIGVYTVTQDISVYELARQLGMSYMDFRRLNPRETEPTVAKGSIVKYKKTK
jgi:hypothetical protein